MPRRHEQLADEADDEKYEDEFAGEAAEPVVLVSTDRHGEFVKLRSFGDSTRGRRRARKHFEKAKAKGVSVVKTKGGRVRGHAGSAHVVTFLIGVAFGAGECDLGPLARDGDPLKIFVEEDDERAADEDDDDDDDDKAGDQETWVLIKVRKAKGGISIDEMHKKKKAKSKFDKLKHRKRTGILVHGGVVRDVAGHLSHEHVEARQITFMIGCAAGKGLIKPGGLGPAEDGGNLAVYEDEDW